MILSPCAIYQVGRDCTLFVGRVLLISEYQPTLLQGRQSTQVVSPHHPARPLLLRLGRDFADISITGFQSLNHVAWGFRGGQEAPTCPPYHQSSLDPMNQISALTDIKHAVLEAHTSGSANPCRMWVLINLQIFYWHSSGYRLSWSDRQCQLSAALFWVLGHTAITNSPFPAGASSACQGRSGWMGRFKLLAWFSDDQQGLFQRCYNGTLTTLTVFFCVDSKNHFLQQQSSRWITGQAIVLFCFVFLSYPNLSPGPVPLRADLFIPLKYSHTFLALRILLKGRCVPEYIPNARPAEHICPSRTMIRLRSSQRRQ